MKAFLILTLLLAFSCTKYAEFSKDGVGTTIEPIKMEINRLNEIEWFVGKPKETHVTQSITFVVNMPEIRQDDLDYLTENKNVNAWILRLIVNRGSETQDLGSLYTPFRPLKITRGNKSAGAATSVSLKIYYAAAYASERFRAFNCPAFGHNLKVDKMDIKGDPTTFSITIDQATPYHEKSHLVELAPSSFNGGHSLVGEYYVEIAPYDSKRRMILSSFKRLPQSVVVSREEKINVKSCAGVHPEITE